MGKKNYKHLEDAVTVKHVKPNRESTKFVKVGLSSLSKKMPLKRTGQPNRIQMLWGDQTLIVEPEAQLAFLMRELRRTMPNKAIILEDRSPRTRSEKLAQAELILQLRTRKNSAKAQRPQKMKSAT